MFKCSFCGKEYNTPVDRARCEIECDNVNAHKGEFVSKSLEEIN